jgi:hypothetical protein
VTIFRALSKKWLGMYGIAKTLVGYLAASVGRTIDVEHRVIRLSLLGPIARLTGPRWPSTFNEPPCWAC